MTQLSQQLILWLNKIDVICKNCVSSFKYWAAIAIADSSGHIWLQ